MIASIKVSSVSWCMFFHEIKVDDGNCPDFVLIDLSALSFCFTSKRLNNGLAIFA